MEGQRGAAIIQPPWGLIPAALRKLRDERALVLAILPLWTTRFWWPWVQDMTLGTPILTQRQVPVQGQFRGAPSSTQVGNLCRHAAGMKRRKIRTP